MGPAHWTPPLPAFQQGIALVVETVAFWGDDFLAPIRFLEIKPVKLGRLEIIWDPTTSCDWIPWSGLWLFGKRTWYWLRIVITWHGRDSLDYQKRKNER